MARIVLAAFSLLLISFIFPVMENDSSAIYSSQHDGPYVWYANGQVQVRYILDDNGTRKIKADSLTESAKDDLVLSVATDTPDKPFEVKLKKNIQKEKSVYKKPTKQFVLSDIEGNFGAFRKLLQAGGVIDSQYNWIFGDGHLVLIGDFVDRGEQVTEVLWLIYSLEEKAKAAGGYVHYVLGNHEIMIMSGDFRYVNKKYFDVATQLSKNYINLFSENTELGRWLRSKNIMEKIGDMLYMHGGISADINRMDVSVESINELAQPFYPDSTYQFPDRKLDTIFSDNGPFWYRGYYGGKPKASPAQIDSTLDKFGVRHVATGHTVVGDTISTWFDGKVINTDLHHAGGKSEALFIEDGAYYRVKPSGEKILLMNRKR